MIYIENSTNNVLVQAGSFVDNMIRGHIMNVILIPKLQVIDTNCSINNSTSDLRMNIFKNIGGCFRTQNIFYRNFKNVKISNSFSDKTSFGIKIIDDLSIFYQISLNSLFSSQGNVSFFF